MALLSSTIQSLPLGGVPNMSGGGQPSVAPSLLSLFQGAQSPTVTAQPLTGPAQQARPAPLMPQQQGSQISPDLLQLLQGLSTFRQAAGLGSSALGLAGGASPAASSLGSLLGTSAGLAGIPLAALNPNMTTGQKAVSALGSGLQATKASGIAGSTAGPYLGAAGSFVSGLTSPDPSTGMILSSFAGPFGPILTGLGSMIGHLTGLNRAEPSEKQTKAMNAGYTSGLGRQFIADLQEVTTPQELLSLLDIYRTQQPVTFQPVVGGQNAPGVTFEQLLTSPEAFNIGAENINVGDYNQQGQLTDPIRAAVLWNAQLLNAATQGDPNAQAELARRSTYAKDRQQRIDRIASIPGVGFATSDYRDPNLSTRDQYEGAWRRAYEMYQKVQADLPSASF